MNKIKLLIVGIGVSGVLFLLPVSGLGQAAADSNYEVTVQVLMGSDDASAPKGSLPGNLSAISQQIKSKVGYSNFRLVGTIIGRIANQGGFEYKSFSDLFGQDPKFRSFLELTVAGLKADLAGKEPSLDIQMLKFGAKVPVVVGFRRDEAGKDQPSVSYEQIGLTLSRLGISENVPTLVGTLDVPNGPEMIFLIVTVKTLDR
ncbi:MAG: hypothetical protein ABL999_18835 [Pyrinomonadaceae bacterium]